MLHNKLRATLESYGLSLSSLRDGKVSSAFYSGKDFRFEVSFDNKLDLSFLQFTSKSSAVATELWNRHEKLDSAEYSDGSVCACAFEIDFDVKVELMTAEIFHFVVDPSHHHVYLFVDSQPKWKRRITTESWSMLREFIRQKKVNALWTTWCVLELC